MKKTAAQLAVYALEQMGITHTFGIPGVHNTELYDVLGTSKSITPVLVTHEQGGAFMAEGMSRTDTSGNIGTLMIVPAAGFTHAMSGIGEAYLGGVPLLVMTGGIRTDTPWQFKLHGVDQMELAKGITKAAFRITRHEDVIPTLYEARRIACEGFPGPVLVEIPVNLQIFEGEIPQPLPTFAAAKPLPLPDEALLHQAAALLRKGGRVGIFAGWGARHAAQELVALSHLLNAPVATTLQGLSTFPGTHPLHTGFGIGPSAVPAVQNAFKNIDVMLAVGVRFAEIPTGSFAVKVPQQLIHIDIDPAAVSANYPAQVALIGDAQPVLSRLVDLVSADQTEAPAPDTRLMAQIARDKAKYRDNWRQHKSPPGQINPLHFYDALQQSLADNAVVVLDDGNHTYLTAELMTLKSGHTLITPTDFNAMGYAVPAAIGAKLANPARSVCAIVGDGCFTMTCMEMLTAKAQAVGVVYCVFRDGELSQIAQAQEIPYGRKVCSILPGIDLAGAAQAVGAEYLFMSSDTIVETLVQAFHLAGENRCVVVDIPIDYSRPTVFTRGTGKLMFKSFDTRDKWRFAKRAIGRKLFG